MTANQRNAKESRLGDRHSAVAFWRSTFQRFKKSRFFVALAGSSRMTSAGGRLLRHLRWLAMTYSVFVLCNQHIVLPKWVGFVLCS